MNIKVLWVFISVIMLTVFLAACGGEKDKPSTSSAEDSKKEAKKLHVYTTIYPFEYFANRIGGQYVEAECIMPPGADDHSYEPSTKQIVQISNSDLFIYNGLGLESYAGKITSALEKQNVKVVEASKGLRTIEHEDHDHEHHDDGHDDDHHEEEHHHDHGDEDPHVWIDPERSITLAENIKNALVELKPQEKELFEKNFAELKADLQSLNKDFSKLIGVKKNPKIIVSHAAYGYWEDRYGLKQIPIAGLSPSEEPSQKDLARIVSTAKKDKIKYVIFEQNVTPKVAEIIRKEIKAEPLHLHNLAVLTDQDIKNHQDYISLMKENLKTLKQALD